MPSDLSYNLIRNYIVDYFRIAFHKFPINKPLEPLFFTYYVTLKCNFKCSYCNLYTRGETSRKHVILNTNDTIKLMEIIKRESTHIYFTGGEPLMRNDIVEIVKKCKEMGFRSISIATNMSLINKKMEILDYITNLVSSFDIIDDAKQSEIFGIPVSVANRVKNNIIECAKLQKEKDFIMTINCVVTEKSIQDAVKVMRFCNEHGIRFAIAPAEMDGGGINPSLSNNKRYEQLIKEIMKFKKHGKRIFGSQKYFKTIFKFKRFECYPTLTPHIYPNGDLLYPCEPLSKVALNLLKIGSYKKALKIGVEKYESMPTCQYKCYKACYIEPSIYIKNPFLVFKEFS